MSESELRQAYSLAVQFYRMLTTLTIPGHDVNKRDVENLIQDLFEKAWVDPRKTFRPGDEGADIDDPTLDEEVVKPLVRIVYTGHEVPQEFQKVWLELWDIFGNWQLWDDIVYDLFTGDETDKSWYLTDWLAQRDPADELA